MIFTFIVLWLITIILIVNNPRNESTRWVALVTFCGGTGGFVRAAIENFLPYLSIHGLMNTSIEAKFYQIYSIGSFTNTYGLPYSYLIFCLCYSELFGNKLKLILKVTFLCPVILMFFITPLTPVIVHNYKVAILWVAPYIIAGSCLLLFTYVKESNPFSKKRRLLTNLIALPPVLFQLLSNYIFRLFHFNEVWRLNAIMMFFLFVLFIIFIIKFDFFGVQLKFERRRIDSTLKAVTSGTSFLNHAIKNEVGKVNILAENIKYLSMGIKDNEIDIHASQILSSTHHLLSMIDRIQHQIQDVKLIKNKVSVSGLLHECVLRNESLFKKFSIAVEEHYTMTPFIECDQIHLKEVISNLFINAVDAMKVGGLLRIETFESRSQICILVKDSGEGISKHDLDHIFDPFYTTKLNSKNYGLGLSYCFNVIQKHGGRIEVFSEQGCGATIKISLPAA